MRSPVADLPLNKVRNQRAKRALDLAVGIPAVVLTAPLLAALIIGVKITSRGPAFFKQARVGRGGDTFFVYKLRTMDAAAEQRLLDDADLQRQYHDSGFKLHEDPRVTRLGRHLRKCSLDELPQLYQVLSGQMSLVGPRPVLEHELHRLYGAQALMYTTVRPGLTGAWQVAGRSHVRGGERVRLDCEYVETWSIGQDLRILTRTIPTVLRRHGAV